MTIQKPHPENLPQTSKEEEEIHASVRAAITKKWHYIGAFLVWFAVGAMPTICAFCAAVPPLAELKLASGELFSERIRYEGSWTYAAVLKNEGTSMHFVCPGFGNDCWEIKKRKDIHGKQAIIAWFEQSKWPLGSRNLLVELHVGQEKVITSEMTQKLLAEYANHWLQVSLVAFIATTFIFWMIDKTIRDNARKELEKISAIKQ